MMRRLFLSLTLAAVAQPAWAQTLGGGATGDVAWGRVLAALVLCLALGIGGAFVLRARLGGRVSLRSLGFSEVKARRLHLVESLRLRPQVNVCLIRCDKLEFVIATSGQGVAILPTGQAAAGDVE